MLHLTISHNLSRGIDVSVSILLAFAILVNVYSYEKTGLNTWMRV